MRRIAGKQENIQLTIYLYRYCFKGFYYGSLSMWQEHELQSICQYNRISKITSCFETVLSDYIVTNKYNYESECLLSTCKFM